MALFQHLITVDTFEQWRIAVRTLLAEDAEPHSVRWLSGMDNGDLFAGIAASPATASELQHETPRHETDSDSKAADNRNMPLQVPRRMLEMLQSAACFRASDRWAFLYQVMWRWQRGEKEVMSPADKDGSRLHAMAKAVFREEHDMHAYVRFRERKKEDGAPRFVAWYEPAHDVLPQVARHFADRMGSVSWMIATPEASVMWNGETLHHTGPLMKGAEEIEDVGETLWLAYYRSIFNPARLNTRVMQSHVPSRFWKNLPEGKLVPAMVAEAAAGARRTGQTPAVQNRGGTIIPIVPDRALPQRSMPTELEQCRRCELWRNATQAVKGNGPDDAQIMLVGEQPGDQEDIAGQPFIGPAGQLLNQVLGQAGIDRHNVYLTNAVKHFKWEPRGKRRLHKTPGQGEIMACRHWLHEEIVRIQPKVIVALGSTALKSLIPANTVNLTDMLGKPFQHEGRWIVATYHPAYVLRAYDDKTREKALQAMLDAVQRAQSLVSLPA